MQTSLKELLDQDIQILYQRFTQLKLDEEERWWHLKRYLSCLDTSQSEVLSLLLEALNERLAKIDSPESEDYAILYQFIDTVKKFM